MQPERQSQPIDFQRLSKSGGSHAPEPIFFSSPISPNAALIENLASLAIARSRDRLDPVYTMPTPMFSTDSRTVHRRVRRMAPRVSRLVLGVARTNGRLEALTVPVSRVE